LRDFASDALLQMLKKKLPPFSADAGDQVMDFWQPTWPFMASACITGQPQHVIAVTGG